MVQVIKGKAADHLAYGGGAPLVHIHEIERHVHGNAIDLKVYGEIKIAAGERVFARELKLKSIEVLVLTPEIYAPDGHGYIAQKYIYHKGEYNNWASIDIYDDAGERQTSDVGRTDGSTWLDFIAEGE